MAIFQKFFGGESGEYLGDWRGRGRGKLVAAGLSGRSKNMIWIGDRT